MKLLKAMRGFGGMVSFNFVSGKKRRCNFLEKNKIVYSGGIFGGVESLANYSVMMAHASIPEDKRKNHR
jgi:cystathionine beta-lyase